MTLSELHEKLSKDASYRKQYRDLDGIVELAMQVRGAREEREISQDQLARETGVSAFDISRFETLAGTVEPAVISALVDHLEVPLRQRGVRVEDWILASTALTNPDRAPEQRSPRGRIVNQRGTSEIHREPASESTPTRHRDVSVRRQETKDAT
jgi:transcriptional regulator with XRE-family HTH domain